MIIRELIFFIVPLLVAGTIHHAFCIPRRWWNRLAQPIDAGRTLKGHPIFGTAKTWRGVVIMVIGTGLTSWLLGFCIHLPLRFSPILSGALIGLGYVLGELPNSFIKRRLGIATSERGQGIIGLIFQIVDQCDSIIGAVVVLFLIYHPTHMLVTTLIVVGTLIHFLIDLALRTWSYKRQRTEAGTIVKEKL